MKRKGNLYNEMCDIVRISNAFNHVVSHLSNKKKAADAKIHKIQYVSEIYYELLEKTYIVSKPSHHIIYEPKKREIVNLNVKDKIVNYLLSKYILIPVLEPCLIDTNVASRTGRGSYYAISKIQKFRKSCNAKYCNYYILKCDISKFFKSIDLDKMKEKVARRIKDKSVISLLNQFLDIEERSINWNDDKSNTCNILFK